MMFRVIRSRRHATLDLESGGPSAIRVRQIRNIKGKITKDGIFVEQLEVNPKQFLPDAAPHLEAPVEIDLNRPMAEVLAELSKYTMKRVLNDKRNVNCGARYRSCENQRIVRCRKTNAEII